MTDPRFMRPGLPFALAKVIEECGEVISAAGKTLRWGTDSCDPTKPATERENNEDWLMRELSDLEGAIAHFYKELMKTTPSERARMFGYGKREPL